MKCVLMGEEKLHVFFLSKMDAPFHFIEDLKSAKKHIALDVGSPSDDLGRVSYTIEHRGFFVLTRDASFSRELEIGEHVLYQEAKYEILEKLHGIDGILHYYIDYYDTDIDMESYDKAFADLRLRGDHLVWRKLREPKVEDCEEPPDILRVRSRDLVLRKIKGYEEESIAHARPSTSELIAISKPKKWWRFWK